MAADESAHSRLIGGGEGKRSVQEEAELEHISKQLTLFACANTHQILDNAMWATLLLPLPLSTLPLTPFYPFSTRLAMKLISTLD